MAMESFLFNNNQKWPLWSIPITSRVQNHILHLFKSREKNEENILSSKRCFFFSAFENWLLFLTILIKALYSFLFVFFWTYSHYWAQIKEDATIFFGVSQIKGKILLEVWVSGPAQCSTQFNNSLFTKVGLGAGSLFSCFFVLRPRQYIANKSKWHKGKVVQRALKQIAQMLAWIFSEC